VFIIVSETTTDIVWASSRWTWIWGV